jgi:hypothetical protein
MIYIYHSMDFSMKEKDELLKVFRTLSLDNQAELLRCVRIAQTAEEAARKVDKGLLARQNDQQGTRPKKEE